MRTNKMMKAWLKMTTTTNNNNFQFSKTPQATKCSGLNKINKLHVKTTTTKQQQTRTYSCLLFSYQA